MKDKKIIIKQDIMDRIAILQKIIDRKITQSEGAIELDLSQRQIRRLVSNYRQYGPFGLIPKHKTSSNRMICRDIKDKAINIIKLKYHDFGPTLISEKLEEIDQISISRETIRKWMNEAGLIKIKHRKKARIHQSRERRTKFGELVQIDGSHHDWFEGRSPKCCLIVMIDDATSRIISAHFETSETTFGYMRAIKKHLEQYGRPIAYYSDKHSIFKTTRTKETDNIIQDTQLHRALKQLKIALICANSPQAKGRVERANQTLQDRLIKEMRLNNINNMEEGNAFLESFVSKYNNKFGVEPQKPEDAHRELAINEKDLQFILSHKESRKITKNLEFSFNGDKYQIEGAGRGHRMRQGEVMIYNTLSDGIQILFEGRPLKYKILYKQSGPVVLDYKELDGALDEITKLNELSTIPQSTSKAA